MEWLTALAEPIRREIVQMLGSGELSAGEIGRRFPVSAPAVSQHLKTLRSAGLVRVRVDGQRRIYSLDPRGLEEMSEWFDRMRGYWSRSLGQLERELQKEPKS